MRPKAFLFDVTACTLCGACWAADKERNNLPVPEGDFTKDILSDKAFLVIERRDGKGVRFSCNHCVDPTCVSLCPVAAFEKTEIGAVIYHKERCIGCRYCVEGCPFGIPKYEWSRQLPYVKKCDFCYSRITTGLPPACAAVCPSGALVFGDRVDMLREGSARIAMNPSGYIDHIYGETEAGGTSLLILSNVPMENLGYPPGLTEKALPSLTWTALREVPHVVLLGGAFLTSLLWLTRRTREVYAVEHQGGKPAKSSPDKEKKK